MYEFTFAHHKLYIERKHREVTGTNLRQFNDVGVVDAWEALPKASTILPNPNHIHYRAEVTMIVMTMKLIMVCQKISSTNVSS